MRTFIAIELPKEIKEFLSRIQSQLRESKADVKWVEPQNIHLTLKFLGEVNEEKLNRIIQILEDIAKDRNQYNIRISSLGAFPKIKSPRIVWAGVDKGDIETKEMAKVLEERINKIGIPREEKAFSSHITIGRTRSGLNIAELTKNLEALEQNFTAEKPEFLVKKITFFKSTLTLKGPIYEILKEANLKTT